MNDDDRRSLWLDLDAASFRASRPAEGGPRPKRDLRPKADRDLDRRLAQIALNSFVGNRACAACGELGAAIPHAGRLYCDECGGELVAGLLPNVVGPLGVSGHGCPLERRQAMHPEQREESGPWGENVVREYEDRFEGLEAVDAVA